MCCVQPDTGVIVHGAEEVWMYYARDDEAAEIYEDDNREAELTRPAPRSTTQVSSTTRLTRTR